MSKKDDKTINMTGECAIIAAVAKDGEPAKLPSVKMNVYNGGKIEVGYWGPVVVDLKGMTANNATPIVYGHNTYDIDAILGQTESVKLGKTITAEGVIMSGSDTTEKVIALAKNGYQFQVSMGVSPLKTREVLKSESVEVNGQTIEGPFRLVTKSKLKEISILPLGADDTTTAEIAAQQTNEGIKMADKNTPTADQIRAQAVAEEKRIKAVREAAKDYPDIMAKAIENGSDLTQVTIEVLKAEKADLKAKFEAGKVKDERPEAVHIKNNDVIAKAMTVDAISAAACSSLGIANIKAKFSDDDLNKSEDVKARTFTELVEACMSAEGKSLSFSRHDTRDFLKAAFSTAAIANVISNVQGKFVNEGYGTTEQAWREIASIRSVNDFKANTGVRLIMSNLLKSLSKDGEIQHGSLSDDTRTIKAGTKALMLAITREDIINDDLGVLANVPRKLGFAAGRTFNVDFWAALEAAVASNFTAGNKNKTTGVLSATTLATAEAMFLALKDADGNPIGVQATKLLAGGASFKAARELFVSTGLIGGASVATASNIYVNMFKPVFSAYLSSKPWYLTGNPLGIPMMEVAFLNGQEMPVIETADADFNTLGIQTRCVYDYGVAFAEAKSAVYSTGE